VTTGDDFKHTYCNVTLSTTQQGKAFMFEEGTQQIKVTKVWSVGQEDIFLGSVISNNDKCSHYVILESKFV
jgi:hypothetical protein